MMREERVTTLERNMDLIKVSRTLREAYERGFELGFKEGFERACRDDVLVMLHLLFVRRVGRVLTDQERDALIARATRSNEDPAEVQARALSLEGEALAAWLLDPNAK